MMDLFSKFSGSRVALVLSSLIFCAALLGWGREIGASQDEKTTLRNVQNALRQGRDFAAHFRQSYHDALRDKTRSEEGTLQVKQDGRLRFAYSAPSEKLFVFDGNTAYFSEPQAGQVTVFPQFRETVAAQTLMILWGQAPVDELFTAVPCRAPCPSAEKGESIIALEPRRPVPTITKVALVIVRDEVRRACVYDPLGNTTEYQFTDITHPKNISSKTFYFEVPAGVSVLYAPSKSPPEEQKASRRQPDIKARDKNSL